MTPDELRMTVAPRWRIWIAKVFGEKHIVPEPSGTWTYYSLRGKYYLWSVE